MSKRDGRPNPLTVRIDAEERERIESAAAQAGIPVNRWVVNAIKAALAEQSKED